MRYKFAINLPRSLSDAYYELKIRKSQVSNNGNVSIYQCNITQGGKLKEVVIKITDTNNF